MDDCIVCVLRNGFTAHERTIVEGGDPGRVIEMRQDFQRLMERQYRETIEAITGRRVVAFLSQAHLEPDITLEIFFLDRPMNGSAALDLDLPEHKRHPAANDRLMHHDARRGAASCAAPAPLDQKANRGARRRRGAT